MADHEVEIRRAFEETTNRNIKTIQGHSNETRKIVRDLEYKITQLEKTIETQNVNIKNLKLQLSHLQTRVFKGGT